MDAFLTFIYDQIGAISIFFVALTIQLVYFIRTHNQLKECTKIFNGHLSVSYESGVQLVPTTNKVYQKICLSLNKYITANRDNISLEEMERITDNICDSFYDKATSKISLPMYVGLGGTYLGVSIGLAYLIIGTAAISTNHMASFIGSIVVAMLTSLFGLVFTMTNNLHQAPKVASKLEDDKIRFFTLLQTEVMPQVPSTMQDSLVQFRSTVTQLKDTVEELSTNLTDTFKDITAEFGKNLQESLGTLSDIFINLKQTASSYVQTLQNQDKILEKLQSEKFEKVLSKIDGTVSSCHQASAVVDQIQVSANETISSFSAILETQKGLISAQNAMTETFVEMKGAFESISRQSTSYFEQLPEYLKVVIAKIDSQISDLFARVVKINTSNLNNMDSRIQQYAAESIEQIVDSGNLFLASWKQLFAEISSGVADGKYRNPFDSISDIKVQLDSTDEKLVSTSQETVARFEKLAEDVQRCSEGLQTFKNDVNKDFSRLQTTCTDVHKVVTTRRVSSPAPKPIEQPSIPPVPSKGGIFKRIFGGRRKK